MIRHPTDAAISWYYLAMVGTHAVVWVFFRDTAALSVLNRSVEPLCWPFFETCWQWRTDNQAAIDAILLTYLAAIMVALAAFYLHLSRAAWASLGATNLVLCAIVALDYRFRANEIYMLLWINVVYLLWKDRRWGLSVVIVLFYWWAGTLKLNYEWLSGAVLYSNLFLIPPALYPAACAYVLILEMGLIWGLLAERRWIVLITLGQLALFHLQSLSQIHWFYPLLMAAILSWFPLMHHITPDAARPTIRELLRGRAPRSTYVLIVTFSLFQLVPAMYKGDAALTGQGRLFALHMFEARQVCDVTAVLHTGDGQQHPVDLKWSHLNPRMVCDPVVYFNRLQTLCRDRQQRDIREVDFRMSARRTTDPDMYSVADVKGACDKGLEYDVLGNNSWMTLGERRSSPWRTNVSAR